MRLIHAGLHRILDFVTVFAFAAAPFILGLTGGASVLSYLLAGVHLVLTLLTQFRGDRGLVPLKVHGAIEFLVGLALVVVPFVLVWVGVARAFYIVAGVVILLVWALSGYDKQLARAAHA